MSLFGTESWIKSPSDRDVIERWTVGKGEARTHELALTEPDAAGGFRFLVVGDTGDAENGGGTLSPQDAIAREMAADFASETSPALILHLGDVVYMTGEERLYDRNFRRPYTPFLTPESTAGNLIFRVPFLPVPGNHDYYDVRSWVLWLARIPLIGPGLRSLIRQLFAFEMPEGGSEMGRTYMEAFVDLEADTSCSPLHYIPGSITRLPNRYYRFRHGIADFFALDSNTLDAPPPWRATPQEVRQDASARVAALEERYRTLERELRGGQRRLDTWHAAERERISSDPVRREQICRLAEEAADALAGLAAAMCVDGFCSEQCAAPAAEMSQVGRRWRQSADDLCAAGDGDIALRLIEAMEGAREDASTAMRGVEGCLAAVGENEYRSSVLRAREGADRAIDRWIAAVSALPAVLSEDIRDQSDRALDIQRELALERRRLRFRAEDYDFAQLEWLKEGLERSARERPNGWRIVYLHHPLYSSIGNHCEQSDIRDTRANLLEILRGRAHLVLSGHSHAFEWFRSAALPGTAFVVSGGGGQVSLRSSILEPHRFARNRHRYHAMREAGALEWCGASKRPAGSDGTAGNLYHYLQIDVTDDAIVVRPIGARRVGGGRFRRESPIPVFHAAELGALRPALTARQLLGIEIHRTGTVTPRWAGDNEQA